MRFLAGVFLALASAVGVLAGAAHAAPVNTGHLTAELAPQARGVAPGQTIHVALVQQIQDGWHTYWRNPGDSGEPTSISWTLPSGWTAGEIVWPRPHRLPVGPLVNYGFEGQVVLPVPVSAPADARPGETVRLKAKANFLVCAEICVPESADLSLELPVTAGPAPADGRWGPVIEKALAQTPRPAGLAATFEREAAGLKLAVTGPAVAGADLADAYFFPFSGSAIDHAGRQLIERGPQGLTLTLPPGVDFQAGDGPSELSGVLTFGDQAIELTASRGAAIAGAAGLGPPPAREGGGVAGAGPGLIGYAAFALLGGLILNLMPCVFPVLAMKASSLAAHGGSAGARRDGLAFGAGVLVTFLALAGLLIALKAAGSEIGWGFQLQSPPVVGFLALLMLAVALNLSGVFEVGGSLQNVGAAAAARGGTAGAFFTGVLAVVVAAPCTAPFMGVALGWALAQPAAPALVVFAALAVGFAAPFVAVAFAPGLLTRLPKPGPWMDAFRKALAFPMYAAAAWLAWVLAQQAGADGLARLFAAAVVLALAAWLAGIAQRQSLLGRRPLPQAVAAGALAAIAVAAVVGPRYAESPVDAGAVTADGAAYEPYSPERLASLRAEGRPVFVNYTAAWCVSCQVNERVALSTRGVAEAMARNGVVYLKADWTKKDAAIAAELALFGRAGVPLYLVYGRNGAEPRILPALLTEGLVVKALDAASTAS